MIVFFGMKQIDECQMNVKFEDQRSTNSNEDGAIGT